MHHYLPLRLQYNRISITLYTTVIVQRVSFQIPIAHIFFFSVHYTMSSSKKYPIINIEPLNNKSTSSKQKPLGYHGTSSSNANSIMKNGFTKEAFAMQDKKGL